MTDLQQRLVDMLSFFHSICVKYNLRYYIIAGTMLGAIRHGGFIPWDDDIDVGMPRSDYEKLMQVAKHIDMKKYKVEFPFNGNREYPYLIAKMYDTQTTFVEKQRYPIKRGIYIDIFPIDGIGNSLEKAKENYKPFYRYYRLNLMISSAFLKRRNLKKNMAVLLGRIVSPLFINKYRLMLKIDRICKKNNFDESKFVCNLLGGAGTKGIVPKEYFGTPTAISFENIQVFGLEQPDLYLKSMYGNYMKLPPIEKRVSLHDTVYCDLNKSYLED